MESAVTGELNHIVEAASSNVTTDDNVVNHAGHESVEKHRFCLAMALVLGLLILIAISMFMRYTRSSHIGRNIQWLDCGNYGFLFPSANGRKTGQASYGSWCEKAGCHGNG